MNQSTGGDAMTVKSLVVIDGEKIEIKDLEDTGKAVHDAFLSLY